MPRLAGQYAGTEARAHLYLGLLLTFPVLVMFSPRLALGFTHARIDELLLVAWAPAALRDYFASRTDAARRVCARLLWPFFVLFAVFLMGLLYGQGEARWTHANLKLVTRPLFVALNILVVRYWLLRSRATTGQVLAAFVLAALLAGAVGVAAMRVPELAAALTREYAPALEEIDDPLRFDMAKRAMSVFTGYDQAGVTYAIATVLALHLFFRLRGYRGRVLAAAAMAGLLIAIVTSARIGFVSLLAGSLTYLLLGGGASLRWARATAVLGLFLFVLFGLSRYVVPHSATLERFADVWGLFDLDAAAPYWERSEGVRSVVESQVFGLRYPDGFEMLLGFGDSGEFVSDSGYVTVFVKYGIVGLAALFYSLHKFTLVRFRLVGSSPVRHDELPFAGPVLPSLVALLAVASFKGGLYFLTYKVGELFALLLALAVVETARTALGRYGGPDVASVQRTSVA